MMDDEVRDKLDSTPPAVEELWILEEELLEAREETGGEPP